MKNIYIYKFLKIILYHQSRNFCNATLNKNLLQKYFKKYFKIILNQIPKI